MLKTPIMNLARLAPALALFSCAAPKANVVEETPAPKKEVVAKPDVPEPPVPSAPDDGLRLPDMMTMPSDNELRATNPSQAPAPSGVGAVIARPPTEPPSRQKD